MFVQKEKNGSKSRELSRGLIFTTAVLMSLALVAYGSYSAGFSLGFDEGLGQTRNIVIQNVANMEAPEDSEAEDVDFSIFWEVWDMLQAKHPDIGTIDKQNLVYGAIRGMTDAIMDPNTVFFTPEDAQKFSDDINGSFSGIGAEIGIRDEQLIIIAPLKDSPAEKAGVQVGDKVLAIDGISTVGISTEEAAKKMRGDAGTTIVLRISRESLPEGMDISIVRDNIQIPTIDASTIGKNENILHIQVYNFNSNLSALFYKTVFGFKLSDHEGIILDLRNNPGGFLDEAVDLAGWFLEKGKTVVIEEFSSGQDKTFSADGNGSLRNVPMVILVNGGSASASEIVAGALRVNRGIQLVGETTFGKGTVQQLEDLSDDSSLKVTVANWLLPDETLIEGNGLIPNYVVELTDEDILAGRDPQLDKAVELLEAQLGS
ncbi:MAG: S41 family peptidase [Candidatus Colwellbacteria bacterium]|nr:S41 family peptidase [Candidatus Colwellbacteria bacterium]